MTTNIEVGASPANTSADVSVVSEIASALDTHTQSDSLSPLPKMAPKHIRNIAFGIIALAALVWLLKFAEAVIIPVLLGVILSYSLRPVVEWFVRVLHVPRPVSAAILLVTLFGGIGAGLWNLREDVTDVVSELPKAVRMMRELAGTQRDNTPSIMGDIRKVATEIDQAAATLTNERVANVALKPVAEKSTTLTRIQAALVEQLSSILSVLSTMFFAGLLAFFLLCAGTEYRKKLLQMVGQSLSRKKITLTILNEINVQIQYYLATTAVTNILLGLATWALFAAFGIERAFLWGIVAALLHLIPYLGVGLFLGVCFVIGLVSLNSFWPAFYLTLSWLAVQFVIGFCLNSYIQGRSARINSAALFVGFLIFGWLWGGWGLIVAAPVLAALKAVTSRVESLKDVSTLLA
jgi:predicted PurR-regulated permease PerM